MNSSKIYDIIGIGIGPFNLGLAALVADIPELTSVFVEKNNEFNWHPGMMLPTAKMQVPFLADLVTLADPCNRFSYLNYLKSIGRLFKFSVSESYYPYRSEYNNYCQWVVGQLTNLNFAHCCTKIEFDEAKELYTVYTINQQNETICFHGKHIIIGVGSEPYIPENIKNINHPGIFHSSEYMKIKPAILMHKRITVIGSGQSAAEIFLDLLSHMKDIDELHWFTRSERFHPMEYAKFTLEMSTPEYINYFYSLEENKKQAILSRQQFLFRGINASLIDEIYQQLYLMELDKSNKLPMIKTSTELCNLSIHQTKLILRLHRMDINTTIEHATDALILATGYSSREPAFMSGIDNLINRDKSGSYCLKINYAVDELNTIFLQNADLHSHGFNSADLGLGPYRNAVILNAILKREYFSIEKTGNIFQQFG